MQPHISTFLHLLELAACASVAFILVYVANNFFGLDLGSSLVPVLGFILDGVAKYARASGDVPIPDYVNKQ